MWQQFGATAHACMPPPLQRTRRALAAAAHLPHSLSAHARHRSTPPPQADPPEFSRIPPDDIVGVTVILLTCSYKGQVGCAAGVVGVLLCAAVRAARPPEPLPA